MSCMFNAAYYILPSRKRNVFRCASTIKHFSLCIHFQHCDYQLKKHKKHLFFHKWIHFQHFTTHPYQGRNTLPLSAGSLFRASRAAGTTTLKGKVWIMRSSLRHGPNCSISPSLPSIMTSSISKTSRRHRQIEKKKKSSFTHMLMAGRNLL